MGKKVYIDPGHGGKDSGAVYQNLIERDINLVVSFAEKEVLERHGVEVKMSRYDNSTYVELDDRCKDANNWGADLFNSNHENAGGGNRGEVIRSIYHGEGEDFANKVSEELKKIGQTQVNVYGRQGQNGDYYAVIRGTNMPAIIVEGCFLDNEEDNDFIDTIEEQKAEGVAIAKAVLRQLGIAYQEQQSTPQPQPTNSDDIVYIVKSGDTLSKIGAIYGVSYQKIASDNEIANPSLLNIGQRLVIKKATQTPHSTPVQDTNKYGVVTASVLNVRSGRGTQYGVIGQLTKGQKVKLDNLIGDWWSIYFGDHGGFVHKNYIQQV